MQHRFLPRAAAGAAVVALALALVPSAVRPSLVPCRRDLLDFFLPMKAHLAASLAAGHVPWWDPFTAGGQPFFANLQSQVFYPPNWVFLVAALPLAMSLFLAAHLAWAGLGAWGLARALGLRRPSALLCALAFTGSGYVVSLADLTNQICTEAWLPWTCWAGVAFARRGRRRELAAWATAASLSLLAGEPQLAVLGGGMSVIVAAAVAGRRRNRALRRVALGALAVGALVAATTAFQVGPLAELALLSDRTEGEPFHAGGRHALGLPALASVVVRPDASRRAPAGPYVRSLYVGAVPLGLAALALLARRRTAATLALVTSVSAVLAAGPSVPVLGRLVLDLTPWLRYPAKYACLAALAVPLLAALGLQAALAAACRRLRRGRRPVLLAAWAVALGVGADLALAHRGLVLALPAADLLAPTPAIEWLSAHTHADGPRAHAPPVTAVRLRSRAARHRDEAAAGLQRERVELLEGALPALFRVHATWGATALTFRRQADLLQAATGPLSPEVARALRAGYLLDDAARALPLPRIDVDGGAARLYALPGAAGAPRRAWIGPNRAVGPAGVGSPSAYPGWREVAPGDWRFRPSRLVPLAVLSALAWLFLAWLAAPRRAGRGRPGVC